MDTSKRAQIKFLPPEISAPQIVRAGIDGQRMLESKLTFLCAPGGFGKTTTILQTLKTHPVKRYWCSLQAEDADLHNFYTSLAEAFSALAATPQDAIEKAFRSCAAFSESEPMLSAAGCRAIWQSLDECRDDHYLVLDNYHEIPPESPVQAAVAHLLNTSPAHFHFIIASRSKMDFLFEKFSLNHSRYLIDRQILRFTVDEIRILAENYKIKQFSETQVKTIMDLFDGEPAAIVLLFEIFASKLPAPVLQDKQNRYRDLLAELEGSLTKTQLILLLDAALLGDFSQELLPGKTDANTSQPLLIQASLLGNFRVALNGQEISPARWKTKKIGGIFKYLLVNKGRRVSREVLAEKFWPESAPVLAASSLRVALCELRKLLKQYEPTLKIVEEDKFGLYLSDRLEQQLDVVEFETLYKQLHHNNPSAGQKKELIRRLLELYQGDFLANENLDDWMIEYRNYYLSIFVEVSLVASDAAVTQNELETAEELLHGLLSFDPYNEVACAKLIEVYKASGNKNQAQSLRKSFSKQFFKEFGEMPSL